VNGERIGFVLASVVRNHPDLAPADLGWLDALVVAPAYQRRGIGHALLEWAEDWLQARGRTRIRLGGGICPFAPGVAAEWNVPFFRAHGYAPRDENPSVQDFGRDLREYASPSFLRVVAGDCRPAQAGDVNGLREFLTREFPGRWLYEFEQHLRDGARVGDYMLLETARGIDACCVMTFEDSVRPVERYYPSPLPRPWGQVGAIGVSADRRGAGYGSALLDAALHHLRARGVRGCIIDWTHHVGYYERFGFQPRRKYEMLVKDLRP
jgi:GNAT superfamily N-acetyltransferase